MPEFTEGQTGSFFADKDPEITIYKEGDPVTRNNLVWVIIESFKISRGSIVSQTAYLEWLKGRTGFNWIEVFQQLLNVGGWNGLAGSERKLLQEAFFKYKKGHRAYKGITCESFNGQIRGTIETYLQYRTDLIESFPNLDVISKKELIELIGVRVLESKAY